MPHILSDVIVQVPGVLFRSMTYPSRAGVIQYPSPQLKILTVPSQSLKVRDHDEGDDDPRPEAELLSLIKP